MGGECVSYCQLDASKRPIDNTLILLILFIPSEFPSYVCRFFI